ncbi:hypothetical protein Tco_1186820, partial [Tanacetum coccineum]
MDFGELPKQQKCCSKKANVIPRGLAWSKLSNPNVALITSPEVMRQSWFMASVDSIKGLADQDDKFIQDEEARVNCIEHDNGMCGDTEVGNFVQVEEARVNGIEHQHGMCGDIEDDGVHLSQTNDAIQEAVNRSTMSPTSPQAINPALANFFSGFDALKKEVFLLKKRKDD